MKKKGIAVVGRVAEGTELLDGQTVKTKILYEELRKTFPDRKIICIDTYQYRKNIVSILYRTVKAFAECEHFFVLLSRNGRKFFFPILNGMNSLFHRKLYHDVVGGALPGEAAARPALVKQLKRFIVNWVELPDMKAELEKLGVRNVEVLPNFKRLSILGEDQLPAGQREEPYVFTMFSRVVKEKGMETAARSAAELNRRAGRIRAVVHIYGPVDPVYEEEFRKLLEDYKDCVVYQGCIPYNESVKALSGSYMLLFPSVYPGEGMPGTIIDAFSAGLPVIASDWRYNRDMVQDGVTGCCYEWQKPEQLTERMAYAVDHPAEIDAMRPACLREAQKYTPESAMRQIVKKMRETADGGCV